MLRCELGQSENLTSKLEKKQVIPIIANMVVDRNISIREEGELFIEVLLRAMSRTDIEKNSRHLKEALHADLVKSLDRLCTAERVNLTDISNITPMR